MEFSTYIIKKNTDKTVTWGKGTVLTLIIAALIMGLTGFVKTASVLFILAVIAGIVMFVIKKGNIEPYLISQDKLVITPTSIEIAGVRFEIEKVKDLKFNIHSYNGLSYKEGKNGFSQTS